MVATFCCLAERFAKFKHPVIYLITSKVATNDLCVDRLYRRLATYDHTYFIFWSMIAHTFAIHGDVGPQCCCLYLAVNFRWTWMRRP